MRDANVNARDAELRTPLHLSVLNGDHSVSQALCDHGALVNAADEDGQTPLHKAAVQGQLELVQELIARGGDVNARLQASHNSPDSFLLCQSDHPERKGLQVQIEMPVSLTSRHLPGSRSAQPCHDSLIDTMIICLSMATLEGRCHTGHPGLAAAQRWEDLS